MKRGQARVRRRGERPVYRRKARRRLAPAASASGDQDRRAGTASGPAARDVAARSARTGRRGGRVGGQLARCPVRVPARRTAASLRTVGERERDRLSRRELQVRDLPAAVPLGGRRAQAGDRDRRRVRHPHNRASGSTTWARSSGPTDSAHERRRLCTSAQRSRRRPRARSSPATAAACTCRPRPARSVEDRGDTPVRTHPDGEESTRGSIGRGRLTWRRHQDTGRSAQSEPRREGRG